MPLQFTKDQVAALHAAGDSDLEIVHPETQQACFAVDADIYRQALHALRQQQDREFIAQGIKELEAREGIPVAEARAISRAKLLARGP